jgi:hypothetical protein
MRLRTGETSRQYGRDVARFLETLPIRDDIFTKTGCHSLQINSLDDFEDGQDFIAITIVLRWQGNNCFFRWSHSLTTLP